MSLSSYELKFQLGDFVLFRKNIPLKQTHTAMSLQDDPINELAELPIDHSSKGQYFPRLIINNITIPHKLSLTSSKLIYIRYKYPNYIIKLDGYTAFDDYLAKFSAKTRGTLKRKLKKTRNNGFTEKVYCKEEDVDEFHKYSCLVGEQTYQKRRFNAAIPNTEEFKKSLKIQATNNEFLGIVLFIEGQPCAYLYCPIINNTYVYSYLGYLSKYSRFSPGTVLQLQLLNYIYSQQNKASYFDFTEGDGSHKKLFSTHMFTCCNCLVAENSLENQFWFRAQIALDALSSLLGQVLNKLKIKQTIKRIIRL